MINNQFDFIVIGCGSGGLSTGLFLNRIGFKILMISKSDRSIGGDCLNEGCIPSKSLIHVAKIISNAKHAESFGLTVTGNIDIKKTTSYIYQKQEIIREHENASWLKQQGVEVALGDAHFTSPNEVEVNGTKYPAKKIVIATGSRPKKLQLPGIEFVKYFDNTNVFNLNNLPENLLVIGGGPIGIEIAQALSRLGSKVTIIDQENKILPHEDRFITDALHKKLQQEGIEIILNAKIERFNSASVAIITLHDGAIKSIAIDAIFVAVGRMPNIEALNLNNASIEVKDNKIISDKHLRTTNKNVFVCGDVVGDLQFSHAAEFHARIILYNLFSPCKKILQNDHMSWVTFTDPEVATFGLSENTLQQRNIKYQRLEQDFDHDDRAIVDDYQYAKMVLFITQPSFFKKQRVLGGSTICPNAGELIQELILVNKNNLSIDTIFNKIYPYPVASRINQKIIVQYKRKSLTKNLVKLLRLAYRLFN